MIRSRLTRGYSLAEVLVASAVISLAIGGGIRLVATMGVQERAANDYSVATNIQDNAAMLWQLGLSPAEVNAILPSTLNNTDLANAVVPSSNVPVTWGTSGTTTLANSMGSVETITCTVTILNPTGGTNRSRTIQLCRPNVGVNP
jgi:prepilin-type N-terminal cleavage/methylation domain-containing protein